MGVGYTSKMWGWTWLSPHPRPLVLRMLFTLGLYPAQNVGSTWSEIWINTLSKKNWEWHLNLFWWNWRPLSYMSSYLDVLPFIMHICTCLVWDPKQQVFSSCDWTSNKVSVLWPAFYKPPATLSASTTTMIVGFTTCYCSSSSIVHHACCTRIMWSIFQYAHKMSSILTNPITIPYQLHQELKLPWLHIAAPWHPSTSVPKRNINSPQHQRPPSINYHHPSTLKTHHPDEYAISSQHYRQCLRLVDHWAFKFCNPHTENASMTSIIN
jgi:hypothetical protein